MTKSTILSVGSTSLSSRFVEFLKMEAIVAIL